MVTATIPMTGKQIDVWYDIEQNDWCYKGEKTPVARFDLLAINLGNEIKAAKQIRANLNEQSTPETAEIARRVSIAITRMEEASMWLGSVCITCPNTVLNENGCAGTLLPEKYF
ncbi:MAG TPA: hypothetical protein VKO45_01180 [Methanomicrobiales archaeon]|nr:hypothetical protein [Methanomicrobiales archaeon]